MNYWPRWISAIKKRTASLSLMQMGAYDRLLDHYYAEDGPLPGTLLECCRICGAISKQEQAAVQFVLDRFFVMKDGAYTNERADEEILLALPKIAAAKANGSKGGRPKGSGNKPTGFPPGTQDEPTSKAPHPQSNTVVLDADASNPPVAGVRPSVAVSMALRKAGIQANSDHPRLLALCEAGATVAEFMAMLPSADGKDNPFAYLLGAVEGERKRAANTAPQLHRGPLPNKQQAIEQRNRTVAEEWAAQGNA